MPFDQILPAVAAGTVAAGLLIHEGQLYYGDRGLHKVLDLGQWWFEQTGLPLPLGGNVVRKDLGEALVLKIAALLKQSIRYALEHREEALAYALQVCPRPRPEARRSVRGDVRERLDGGLRPPGAEAVRLLLGRAAESGLVPGPLDIQFVG